MVHDCPHHGISSLSSAEIVCSRHQTPAAAAPVTHRLSKLRNAARSTAPTVPRTRYFCSPLVTLARSRTCLNEASYYRSNISVNVSILLHTGSFTAPLYSLLERNVFEGALINDNFWQGLQIFGLRTIVTVTVIFPWDSPNQARTN